jgi:hypothetical protein
MGDAEIGLYEADIRRTAYAESRSCENKKKIIKINAFWKWRPGRLLSQNAVDGRAKNRAGGYGSISALFICNRGSPQLMRVPILIQKTRAMRKPVMAKIEQNPGTGRYELAPKSADQTATITNRETGKTLPLKGLWRDEGKAHDKKRHRSYQAYCRTGKNDKT